MEIVRDCLGFNTKCPTSWNSVLLMVSSMVGNLLTVTKVFPRQ